jgi:hypothetical protein
VESTSGKDPSAFPSPPIENQPAESRSDRAQEIGALSDDEAEALLLQRLERR